MKPDGWSPERRVKRSVSVAGRGLASLNVYIYFIGKHENLQKTGRCYKVYILL